MNHFDDCAGIGGFSLACKWAGIETKWAREIDPYARKVYALRFPPVELFNDVKEELPEELKGQVDLYTCGFPCQPVSCAGQRKGQDDPRWLWPWIAGTIDFLRPRYVLLENVPGLLNRGMGDVLGDLATCGYDAEWNCLPASAFGAPHKRNRVWIVAYPRSLRRRGGNNEDDKRQNRTLQTTRPRAGNQPPILADTLGSDSRRRVVTEPVKDEKRATSQAGRTSLQPENGEACTNNIEPSSQDVADPKSKRQPRMGQTKNKQSPNRKIYAPNNPSKTFGESSWWAVEPDVGRVVDGVPSRVDRLKCLGNAIVPQVAYWIIKELASNDR